nr:MAG: hypothetical protein [Chemarfal virus 54]
MNIQPMIIPLLHNVVKLIAVGVPTTAAIIFHRKQRLSREFRVLKREFQREDGSWRIGQAYQHIDDIRGGLFGGPFTEGDKDQLRRWVADSSAKNTLLQNRLDELHEGNEDGFEVEANPVDPAHPLRRVRRGRRRDAARTVFHRVVASIGQRPYSHSQKLIVEDHARRQLKEMNVRTSDMTRLLDMVVGMYFTPSEEQLTLGAMLKSEAFKRQRKYIDEEK